MNRVALLLLASTCVCACKSTPKDEDAEKVDQVTIAADDLEPLNNFILETRRVIAADFVKIECSIQYFQDKIGFTRDFRFVERTQVAEKDGSMTIVMKNVNSEQDTNIDPALLPRVYFSNGLEVRAYREIRIVFRRKVTKTRPVFLEIDARGGAGLAKMWVSGRLEYEQQRIVVNSQLLYDEKFERYRHGASVG